jgi:uncharacterized protein (TIGR02118 family)
VTIRFSVFYPSGEGSTFDKDYYVSTHVPLAVKNWGLDPKNAQIDLGLNGPYVAAVHFVFPDNEALGAAMGSPGTGEVMADMANYTNIQPVIQTSEIVG